MSTLSNLTVIFDFDNSLINENSDTYVIEKLTPILTAENGNKQSVLSAVTMECGPKKWTQTMNRMIELMMSKNGFNVTLDAFKSCLRTIPLFEENIQLVKELHALGVQLVIVSDANDVYIKEILEEHNIYNLFDIIITNGSEFRDGILKIIPYTTPEIHGCSQCPDNICKRKVLADLFGQNKINSNNKIIYVGDGRNDFCPSAFLLENFANDGYICARTGFTLANMLRPSANPHVCEWKNGKDLYECVMNLVSRQGGSG
jgi:pyridoxal phosphate phosphatase PHOSPHO2